MNVRPLVPAVALVSLTTSLFCQEDQKAPSLPPGVLARVDGKDITVNDYVAYLFESLGKSKLDEFIDRLLLEAEAKRLGVAVEKAAIESALEERIERTIQALYQGDQQRFIDNLAKRRSSLEDHKAKLRQDLYYKRLSDDVILKTRQVTDADLKREFAEVYGEDGIRYVIRHILVARGGDGGAAARTAAEAKERAEKIRRDLEGGADFVQAVKESSDDAFTRRNDGRIPSYRKGLFGPSFHEAVTRLTPEHPLSGVVESARGFHLIQLIEKQVTKFDDVRQDLDKAVREKAPSLTEGHQLTQRLRSQAKIEGL